VQLSAWPGITPASVEDAKDAIEQLVMVIAKTRTRGTTSRKAVVGDLKALRWHLSQVVRLLQDEATVARLMPALLGSLAQQERPELGYAQALDPAGFERNWWWSNVVPKMTATVIDLLNGVIENTTRQLDLLPHRPGRDSIEDARDVPGAGLLSGAGAVALIDTLGGLRPSIKLLTPLCSTLWEAAGGERSEAPNWDHIARQVLQKPPGRRAAAALFMARAGLQASVQQTY
jgi:hypothetical protein